MKNKCNFVILPYEDVTDAMIEDCGKTLSGEYKRENLAVNKDGYTYLKFNGNRPETLVMYDLLKYDEILVELEKTIWQAE
ncbi:MAG: hypothetical protein H8D45_31040 [Bacteroidetes bacterium]|nr:hypothetical protein [Bacteroidota bacterium]